MQQGTDRPDDDTTAAEPAADKIYFFIGARAVCSIFAAVAAMGALAVMLMVWAGHMPSIGLTAWLLSLGICLFFYVAASWLADRSEGAQKRIMRRLDRLEGPETRPAFAAGYVNGVRMRLGSRRSTAPQYRPTHEDLH